MNWQNKLLPRPKKKIKTSFMIRPSKELCEWINQKTRELNGASGNKIICAILEQAMEDEFKNNI